MLKQQWEKLSIKTNEPEFLADKLSDNKKVRNIQVNDDVVSYEQLCWREEDNDS